MLDAFRDPRLLLARPGGVDGLRRAAELAIVLLLGVQAARLAWLLLPPASLGTLPFDAPPDLPVQPARLAIDAFHPQRGPIASADASGLHLFAVRPATGGGSAILATADGPQRSVAAGTEVTPGMVLAEVLGDHVVLDSGGRRSELRFSRPDAAPVARTATRAPAAAAAPAAAPSAAAPSAEVPVVDPARLLAGMGLAPEEANGRITGYTVIPRGNDVVLRQAGLQAGDVLLSVNNEALDPELHAALAETLAGADTITFTFRRDGQIRSATLQTKNP
ncbi:type II secretion system protein N [Luteimonas colneyensis]|nr:type II secretion system protein N [Luteimonas colneyensis]